MPNEFDGRALFEELRERANKIPTPPGVERIGTLMQQTSAEGEPSFYSTERHGGNQLGGAPVKRSWPGPPEWDGLLRLSADRGNSSTRVTGSGSRIRTCTAVSSTTPVATRPT